MTENENIFPHIRVIKKKRPLREGYHYSCQPFRDSKDQLTSYLSEDETEIAIIPNSTEKKDLIQTLCYQASENQITESELKDKLGKLNERK